jgi:Arf/Sar family protein
MLCVVDAAAPQKMATAEKERHKLLNNGSIGSTPLLVLANKIDIQPHVSEMELIEQLQLNYVMETLWMVWFCQLVPCIVPTLGKLSSGLWPQGKY